MGAEITVTPDEFEYLALQKGSLHKFLPTPFAWLNAYRQSLQDDFDEIAPFLPASCGAILDVGSGLGGVNILLNEHFGGHVDVCLLDGEADVAKMNLHRETFNDMAIAERFLRRHGVQRFSYMTPKKNAPRPFDLVVSFGSWCFHYPPAAYLDLVRASTRHGATIIVDVRKGKPDWERQLWDALKGGQMTIIRDAKKFRRICIS